MTMLTGQGKEVESVQKLSDEETLGKFKLIIALKSRPSCPQQFIKNVQENSP